VRYRFRSVLLFAVACLAIVPACRRVKPGMKCQGKGGTCIDGSSALWCIDGSFQRVSCGGTKGCRREDKLITCTQSIGEVGEVCISEGASCSTDGHAMLNCVGNRFVPKYKCHGSKGCYMLADEAHCDMSEADPGDPCTTAGAACSTDHASFLECRDGTFAVSMACRGPKGCYRQDKEVHCDASVAVAGDSCDKGGACTPDGATYLECAEGKFEATPCRGERGCYVSGTQVHCDESRAAEGDRCGPVTETCSMDGKKLLGCVEHKRAVVSSCSHGCTVSSEKKRVICR
jgi:hypothetical protein